ncbi:MAG: hypothetical protein JRN15_16585 [Nitrososphaerota archaeon]|nr:hypothetical protein [Nitrososphaerota archaeon]
MPKTFKLSARINSASSDAIVPVLEDLFKDRGSFKRADDEKGGYVIQAEMSGTSSKVLNRNILSSLRKVEKKTTLRAEWTSSNTIQRYFDYVLKKTEKIQSK